MFLHDSVTPQWCVNPVPTGSCPVLSGGRVHCLYSRGGTFRMFIHAFLHNFIWNKFQLEFFLSDFRSNYIYTYVSHTFCPCLSRFELMIALFAFHVEWSDLSQVFIADYRKKFIYFNNNYWICCTVPCTLNIIITFKVVWLVVFTLNIFSHCLTIVK